MSPGIGINTWVWTAPFTEESLGLVQRAQKMGFDVFEIAVEDPEHYKNSWLDQPLKESGLRPVVCGAFGPSRDLTSDNEFFRRESLAYLKSTCLLCERWGAKTLAGPMYSAVGKRRHVPADQREREWDRAVAGLRQAGRMAADHGVTLAVEPLNRFETDLINTSAQAVRLVDEIALPNVGIHLDTFHMGIEEDSVLQAIETAGRRLMHFHACESNRGTPGRGLVRWEQVKEGLEKINYPGDLVIESFTPQCVSIAAAAAIWRPLAPSQDRLATEGLAFLKQLVGR